MCTYEFAEVDLHWPPTETRKGACMCQMQAFPDTLSWRPISNESGQNMLQLKQARVHASTNRLCQDATHPNKPKTYLFAESMSITYCDDAHPAVTPMVKYIHCSRGHAIVVRRSNELEVEVVTTDLGTVLTPDGEMHLVKVVATVGNTTVWDKDIAKTDTPQKLSLVAPSIRDTMARQGKATLQSKISWKVHGRKSTVAKQLINNKRYPHRPL
jgi:hypothetical protein